MNRNNRKSRHSIHVLPNPSPVTGEPPTYPVLVYTLGLGFANGYQNIKEAQQKFPKAPVYWPK